MTDNRVVSIRKKNRGEVLLITISTLFVFFMLLLPLAYVLFQSFHKGLRFYLSSITAAYALSALRTSLLAAGIAVLASTFFGIAASVLLGSYTFRGKELLGALIDIPFSVSPVIAGLSFLMLFGRTGFLAPFINWLNHMAGWDIKIAFAFPGVALATIFVTLPLVCREILPVLRAKGTEEEEAALQMGAGLLAVFRKITFPHIKWALLYGMVLCISRALGEFGAVNALSKTRGETFTLPQEVDALYMSGSPDSIEAAFAASSILVFASVALIVFRGMAEKRAKRGMAEKPGTGICS